MKKIRKFVSLMVVLAFVMVSAIPWNPHPAEASISDWMRAVSIQPFSTTDFASSNMVQTLHDIKDTGANYVVLTIPYYQANRQSTDMYPSWNTPTDEALITAIQNAHSIGLKVMLKPHLETDYIEWRGNINPAPADRPAWFASYTAMLLHYGRIAQRHGVEDFCLGAELFPMTNPAWDATNTERWQKIIKDVRNVYSGKLTYSANRDGEYDAIQFWPDLDYIGLSAYYNLYHAQNSSPEELEKSWDAWKSGVIEPVQQRFNMPVVITELGYRSIDGSYQTPWDWSRGGNYNETDQANAYTALFEYWNNVPWMHGVALWRWEIDPNAGGPGNTDYTPQHKAAVEVMKQYWAGAGNPTPTEKPNVSTTATISGTVTVNKESSLAVNVVNSGGTLSNAIVDVEVYNNNGQRLLQKFFEAQTFDKSGSKSYTVAVNPNDPGSYHVEVGVFNNNWTYNYLWNSNVTSFTATNEEVVATPVPAPTPIVIASTSPSTGTTTDPTTNPGTATTTPSDNPNGQGTTTPSEGTATTTPGTGTTTTPIATPTPTPTPVPEGNPEVRILTPRDGVHISGVQPFKAYLTNRSLSDYTMFWQVDGDRLNDMYNSTEEVPHKEAMVDFANWNWRNPGEPYTINFVGKDKISGSTIEKSFTLYPNQ